MTKPGSLVCVGVGMTLGSHLTPLSRSHIEQADVVFTGLSDGVMELWLAKMNPDVRSLQQYYREGKPRAQTYREMVEAMLTEVRAGKKVCGAFYGHPGVFALPPRKAIATARREGYEAHMEPGVSAEDCLYADLEIDPGEVGCQHFEASQLMFYRRRIDPTAYLVLWQIGIAGDQSYTRFSTGTDHRQLLVDILASDYPLHHEVIVYRAATLPTNRPKIERLALRDLPDADLDIHMTLVIPPAGPLVPLREIREKLRTLDHGAVKAQATARLRLRPLTEADQQMYCDLYSNPAVMQHIGPPLTRAAALRNFGNALRLAQRDPGQLQFYAIVELHSARTVGICGFLRSGTAKRHREAGIVMAEGSQGHGYGQEAFAALVDRAFRDTTATHIVVRIDAHNLAAAAIARNMGFQKRRAQGRTGTPITWSLARERFTVSFARGDEARKASAPSP